MTARIVEADLEDYGHRRAVVALIDMFARDSMGLGAPLPEDVKTRIPSGLRQHPAALVFLAFVGDAAVGVAVCFTGFATFAARPFVNVHDLAVLPEHRRKGIGGQLLATIERRARDLGSCRLTLEVPANNVAAQGLYRRVGFGRGEHDPAAGPFEFWVKPLA